MNNAWTLSLALLATEALATPMSTPDTQPMPVFLRMGFSSVLEFEEPPTRVVLGDSQAFQVERLDQSLVLRTLVAYANTNMFVYFKNGPQKLFVLTASEEAEPTYFRKIETLKAPTPIVQPKQPGPSRAPNTANTQTPLRNQPTGVSSATFDSKKDYLTIEVRISAGSDALLLPSWDKVRLRYQTGFKVPFKLWAERKDVQKDASIRARFIFAKPNVPRDLIDTALIIPVEGRSEPIVLALKRGAR